MSCSKWILALSLIVAPLSSAQAAKPQPPPPAPKIVAMVSPFRAITSDGAIYDLSVTHQVPLDACTDALTSVVLVGRLFASPPVSPIAAAMYANNGLVATLENGDMWFFYESCCVSCYRSGYYLGNIFQVAGASVRFPAFPDLGALDDARPILTNGPEPTAPGMVK